MNKKGFTLVELLIVIGILVILATVMVLVLNPTQFFRQARDSERVSEINAINSALSLYLSLGGKSFGEQNVVYISLPDTSAICGSYKLPALTGDWKYSCADFNNFRNTDGTGWLPIDLTKAVPSTGSLFSTLPIDPINQIENSLYYTYVYDGNKWALSVPTESEKFETVAVLDQGPIATRYEIGTNIELDKGKVEGEPLVASQSTAPTQSGVVAPVVSQPQIGNFNVVWDFLVGLFTNFKRILIALLIYGVLLGATAFSWLAFCMELVEWIKWKFTKKGEELSNPFLSARFYKAIFYSIAFVLSVIFLRNQVAP